MQRIQRIAYRFETGDWGSQLAALERLHFRAAIVGPQGTGKTTLLRELFVRLRSENRPRADHFFLPRKQIEQRQMVTTVQESLRQGRVVLIDGMERLPLAWRILLFCSAGADARLVVTAHRPLWCPPIRLPTWIYTQSSDNALCYVLRQLEMAQPDIETYARRRLAENGGNIRNVLRELYDNHAELH